MSFYVNEKVRKTRQTLLVAYARKRESVAFVVLKPSGEV
jgi:hypothetical protein